MMKQFIGIVMLAVVTGCICSLSSCMQNNGYIGDLWGQWRLENIMTDNKTEECDTVFFSFQSDVFQVRKVIYNSYDYTTFTGLYERSDEMIRFKFLNFNGNDVVSVEDTTVMLHELQSLYIHEASPTFHIKSLDRNNMILRHNNHEYYFKKLN